MLKRKSQANKSVPSDIFKLTMAAVDDTTQSFISGLFLGREI